MTQDPSAQDHPHSTASPRSASAAIEALFREHNQSLVRFLSIRLQSDAEAKEVAQEAYVRLLQLDQPNAVGFLRAFLFKTASNIATDRLRQRTLARASIADDPFEFDVDRLSPEDYASGTERIAIVAQCLRELSAPARQAVLLVRVEGRKLEHVAAELGITSRTVRKYITEALLLIHERLESQYARRSARINLRGTRHGR